MEDSDIKATQFIERHLEGSNYLAKAFTEAEAQDVSERLPPLKPYLVLHTGRCGSTFLHYESMARDFFPAYELLNEESVQHGLDNKLAKEGAPVDDYIVGTIRNLLKKQRQIEEKYVFGLGVTPTQAYLLSRLMNISSLFSFLAQDAFIILTRRNILKQAISFSEAALSRKYHAFESSEPPPESDAPASINDDRLHSALRFLDLLIWQEDYIHKLCNLTPTMPVRYSYEELVDSPEAVVHRILGKIMRHKGEWRRHSTSRSTVKSSSEQHDRLYDHIFQQLYHQGHLPLPSGRKLQWVEFLKRFES